MRYTSLHKFNWFYHLTASLLSVSLHNHVSASELKRNRMQARALACDGSLPILLNEIMSKVCCLIQQLEPVRYANNGKNYLCGCYRVIDVDYSSY